MSLARLLPVSIFRAHWKGLSDYRDDGPPSPDIVARSVIVLLPIAAAAATALAGAHLRSPEALLAGVSLLAGGFLAAYTHIASVREKLTERAATWGDAERLDRDAMDESAAHLLVAAYVSAITAVLLVVAMNFSVGESGAVRLPWSPLIAGTMTYIVVLFLMVLPRLYSAYVTSNKVRKELSGFYRG